MNWTAFMTTEKRERELEYVHMSWNQISFVKNEKVSLFFCSFCRLFLFFYVFIVVELWPNRRLTRRTGRKKKRWMMLTQLDRERNQHPSRVVNMKQCIIIIILERRKKKTTQKKKMNSPFESDLQLADYLYIYTD